MGTYDTIGGTPISPDDEDFCTCELEAECDQLNDPERCLLKEREEIAGVA